MAKKSGSKAQVIVLIIAMAAVLVILAYYFFYSPSCKDNACFNNALWKCNKASFLSEEANSAWYYKIEGFSFGECKVYVKAVSLKTDIETGAALQGKDMTCFIPNSLLGAFMPEEKIEYCHGVLKEEIQRLMIEKMHLYIIQNIGQFNQTKVI